MMAGSTSIVILGATGDLTQRKLMPALFNLACKKRLPEGIRIVGFARSPQSREQFCELVWKGAQEIGELAVRKDEWDWFAQYLSYVHGDLGKPEDFLRLKERLEELEGGEQPANRLFYLAIAPQLYETAIMNLGAAGLAAEENGWRRVVIEKPYGKDLASARALNQVVHRVFDERRVYRIDHYLGKETVQNLLAFRFANSIFEPVWNRNYVDNVQITVAETVPVGDRGAFYDQSGVVRDMVQNHLLQLLTLVAMEPPSVADAESLRNKKVEVLRAIRRWEPEETVQHAVFGQYRGYLKEKGVSPDSTVPTYTAVRLFVDNWRWRGVPFYLRTGKAMAEKVSEIIIQFQNPPHLIFSLGSCQDLTSNILGLCLQPDEGVHLEFAVKVPGEGMCMQPMTMEFHYETSFKQQELSDAYERLLEDALESDSRLFIRNDHIEEAWRVVDPLLRAREELQATPLHIYEPGSESFPAADALLAQDQRTWQRVCGGHRDASS